MVRLSIALPSSFQKDTELVDALRFLMLNTRLEPGCLGCSAWVEPDSTVRYEEEWATEPDARRRVQSDRFNALLSVMESTSEPPSIQFHFVASIRGLDYVAEVRNEVS